MKKDHDAFDTLEEAMSIARGRGHEVTGATMQGSSDNGWVAWLYFETDDGQYCVTGDEGVDVAETPEQAAELCLLAAQMLTPFLDEGLA